MGLSPVHPNQPAPVNMLDPRLPHPQVGLHLPTATAHLTPYLFWRRSLILSLPPLGEEPAPAKAGIRKGATMNHAQP